jgi:hypothetical protein
LELEIYISDEHWKLFYSFFAGDGGVVVVLWLFFGWQSIGRF